MKIDTFYTIYECPVCRRGYTSGSKANACRDKHPTIKKQWFCCEICGKGWSPQAHWGKKGAAELARACEQRHREKGEVEEVSTRTFFFSGGTQGKYYPPGG